MLKPAQPKLTGDIIQVLSKRTDALSKSLKNHEKKHERDEGTFLHAYKKENLREDTLRNPGISGRKKKKKGKKKRRGEREQTGRNRGSRPLYLHASRRECFLLKIPILQVPISATKKSRGELPIHVKTWTTGGNKRQRARFPKMQGIPNLKPKT